VSLTIVDKLGVTSTLVKSNYITVSAGLCRVPNFDGVWTSDAQALWASKGFTTQVVFDWKNGHFKIKSQDIVGGSDVPCNSTITVRKD
jgi:hypothetical protein